MNIFELKTVQSGAFRVLIEALKEILTEANIVFDENGLKIMAMDSSHTVLVHLKLDACKFEKYICESRCVVGVSMINFFKLIKTMTNNDSLTLFIDSDDPNTLGIKIENGDKNSISSYKLNLMDLNEDTFDIPSTEFDFVITMPSIDFQKFCRDMNNLAEIIEIKCVGQQLIFSCKGDFAEQETIVGEANNGMSFISTNTNEESIVQGFFVLKHLVMFTKCTNLSNTVDLYLKNNYPLIICYNVGSLGVLRLCLAPKITDD